MRTNEVTQAGTQLLASHHIGAGGTVLVVVIAIAGGGFVLVMAILGGRFKSKD